jgi:REP element-mobilizing transposase RayT
MPSLTKDNIRVIVEHIRKQAEKKGIYIDFINGWKDHMHCIISLNHDQNISKRMNLIKCESSFWINKNKLVNTKFEWADEYFAISVSDSQINKVRDYIKNQEDHHRLKTWEEEYQEFIDKYGFTKLRD